jgi:hypothetical protein
MEQIYDNVKQLNNLEPIDIYTRLINICDNSKLDFVMYDLYKYTHEHIKDKIIRKDQTYFRDELIQKYNSCIVSGSSSITCEACHIIPYSECDDEDKYNINNGLLLRSDLHILFDKKLIKINPETYCLELDNSILQDYNMQDYIKYNNKPLNISKFSYQYLKSIY